MSIPSETASTTSSHLSGNQPDLPIPITGTRKRRRSSFLDYGGPNSINNFASSLKRSVNYLSSSLGSIGHDATGDADASIDGIQGRSPVSLASPGVPVTAETPLLAGGQQKSPASYIPAVETVVFPDSTPHRLARVRSPLAKTVPEAPEASEAVPTKSTPLQTIFNSINVLIGLGILSVPLGFHMAGWIPGMVCLLLAACSTQYTAVLLGRILHRVESVRTYQDIAVYVYGRSVGYFILLTFSLDLYGAGVSMIILFADSFSALIPSLSPTMLKLLLCTTLLFLNLMPLRFLSFLSLSGIVCTTMTFVLIVCSGLWKASQPGSLLHPMPTNLFPTSFLDFCFSLGLFLAPWGGHATFPEIFSDQQNESKFPRCMSITFSFCYVINALTGIVGFLMFGYSIDSEVTRNILLTAGYPASIKNAIVIMMGVLPLSKLPLVCRPIVTTADKFVASPSRSKCSLPRKFLNRIIVSAVYLASALVITSFGKVMSLLGSAICFTVCITLPVLFYLNVFKNEITATHRTILYLILVVSVTCTIFGSVSALIR